MIAAWVSKGSILTAVFAMVAFLGGFKLGVQPVAEEAFSDGSLVAEIALHAWEEESVAEATSSSYPPQGNANASQKTSFSRTSEVARYLPASSPQKPPASSSSPAPAQASLHTGSSSTPPRITVTQADTSRICDFETSTLPLGGDVLLNEIAWMGGVGSANDEWIELVNRGASSVPLSGWQLIDEDEQVRVIFTAGDTISAHSYVLLERTDDQSVDTVIADKVYSGVLGNTGEGVRLFNPQCVLVDEVRADPSWPAGHAGTRKTMERNAGGLGWHTAATTGGTPKAENSVAPPPPPPEVTLNVILGGDGEGSVRGNPAGIDCGEDCDEAYPSGTEVTLTVTPAAGSEFNRWEGACTGSSECVVELSGEKTVSAVFRLFVSGASSSPPPPSSSSPPSSSPPPSQNEGRLVISEVQLTGGAGATTNDFVEFYNPTSAPFNLKGHRLVKRTANAASDTLIKSWTEDTLILAHRFYLWANSGYTGIAVVPDVVTSGSIADNNGIALRFGAEDTGAILDAVGWGEFQNVLFEGTALSGGLTAHQSYERKAFENGGCISAQSGGEPLGNGCDTNNNANDFELRPQANPQNSQASTEP